MVREHQTPLTRRSQRTRTSGASSRFMPLRRGETGADAAKLVPVQRTQPIHDLLAFVGHEYAHSARVVWMARPLDKALPLRPVDQLDHAVVAQLKPVGQLTHRRPLPARKALQRQQQLVLLRSQAVTPYGLLTETKVVPDPEAKPGQRFEVLLAQSFEFSTFVLRRHDDMKPPVIDLSPSSAKLISCHDIIEIVGVQVRDHPGRLVMLSDQERKALQEVERQLIAEDPEFAQSFQADVAHVPVDHHSRTTTIAIVVAMLCGGLIWVAGSVTDAVMLVAAGGWLWVRWRFTDDTQPTRDVTSCAPAEDDH